VDATIWTFLVLATLTVATVIGCIGVLGRRWLARRHASNLVDDKNWFYRRREWLEARFITLASQSGRPRGLVWADCEFENAVRFARDRQSHGLRALVGLTIRFEAVPDGDMVDNPNVKNLRAATAVFRMERDGWVTDGLAVFNLDPQQTIQHFRHELEDVDVVVR